MQCVRRPSSTCVGASRARQPLLQAESLLEPVGQEYWYSETNPAGFGRRIIEKISGRETRQGLDVSRSTNDASRNMHGDDNARNILCSARIFVTTGQ